MRGDRIHQLGLRFKAGLVAAGIGGWFAVLPVAADPRAGASAAGEPRVVDGRSRTGVNTQPITRAASDLLARLDEAQKAKVLYPVDSSQWRTWSNFHRSPGRTGLRLGELDKEQRAQVFRLLRSALSARGLKMTEDIIRLNHVLGVMTRNTDELNQDDYFLVLFGEPTSGRPWGFQFEGHHLVINCMVDRDQVVMSPTFWGAEPLRTPADLNVPDEYRKLSVLETERAQARRFIESLSPGQQVRAQRVSGAGIRAGAGNDHVQLPRVGLPGKEMSEPQQRALLALLAAFVGNAQEAQATVDMRRVAGVIDDTWFSARVRDDGRIFYRVVSSEILLEFDEVPGVFSDERHVHVVVRRPKGGDYGESILHRHLQRHRH